MSEISFDIVASAENSQAELAKMSTGIADLEGKVISLGRSGIKLNTATDHFFAELATGNEVLQRTVSAQEALNAVGVRTSRQFQEQIRILTALRKAHQDDINVVAQLDRQLELLQLQLGRTNAGMATVTRTSGRSQQAFFQVGQAISDFSAAGLRGALNNLEFLAFQLGASGPIILGLTALGVAFIAFGDDIERAFRPIEDRLNKTKEALEGLIEIANEGVVSTVTLRNLDEANRALTQQQAVVAALRAEVRETRKEFLGDDGLFFGFDARVPFTQLNQAEKELADARAVLDDLEEQVESLISKEAAFESALRNPVIALRAELQKNEELVKALDELYDDIVENQSSQRSGLDALLEKNTAMRKELEAISNIGEMRLGNALEENRLLSKKIEALKEEARIRASLAKIELRDSPAVAAFSQRDQLLGPNRVNPVTGAEEDVIAGGLSKLTIDTEEASLRLSSVLGQMGINFSDLSDAQAEAFEGIVSGADLSAEAFERASISASEFLLNTREGAIVTAGIMADAAGTISSAFSAAYDASGEKARAFFGLSKAFSIAQALISTYEGANKALATLPPPFSFIAAGAVVTAGLANVAKIASTKPGSSGSASSSGGTSVSGSGFIDPRQGRGEQRFQRDTSSAGFLDFRVPDVSFIEIGGEFTLNGSNLTASVERTQRRQQRTRG